MVFATVVLGAALAFAEPTSTDSARAEQLQLQGYVAMNTGHAIAAANLLRQAILALPPTPAYDQRRHELILARGWALVTASRRTYDRGYANEARAMLLRYRARHDALSDTSEAAATRRAEIDDLLARIELELGKADPRARLVDAPAWATSMSVAQNGIARPLTRANSLFALLRMRALARPAFTALRPALRRCYAHALMRKPKKYVSTALELAVEPDGQLVSARIFGAHVVDAQGDACVADAVSELRSVGEPSVRAVRVRVPVLFRWQPRRVRAIPNHPLMGTPPWGYGRTGWGY